LELATRIRNRKQGHSEEASSERRQRASRRTMPGLAVPVRPPRPSNVRRG
jgi:hypothetical protein